MILYQVNSQHPKVIENQNNFDDFVMNGRNRINKGSNTFEIFI